MLMAFAFVLLVVARVLLVRGGLLYGTDRILAIDVLISALLLVGVAVARRAVRSIRHTGDQPAEASTWTDWLGLAAAVLGVPALVVALLTLVAPATPNAYGARACAGSQVYAANYVGVTVGPLGNYARSGPSISFPQTDRFDSGCTLGFEGYCIGDAIKDPFAPEGWTETRWLLVARHDAQPGKALAHVLSGEPADKRFVSLAYIAPKSPERNLAYLGDEACKGGRPRPGKVKVTSQPGADGAVEFKIESTHAERVGVAIALPDNAIRGGSVIRQVSSTKTDLNGAASITWKALNTAQQLVPGRKDSVQVVALAAPCLGPVGPAEAAGVSSKAFEFDINGVLVEATAASTPPDELQDKLKRAACDTERSESPSPSGPGASTSTQPAS